MKFEELIQQISEQFTDAWNRWDMEEMMRHLCPNVILKSPNVSQIYPDNVNNTLEGKEVVRTYWTALYQKNGPFKVRQLSFRKEGTQIFTENHILGTQMVISETFILNEYGKIKYLEYSYSIDEMIEPHTSFSFLSTTKEALMAMMRSLF
jgi:hypothetical protein